MRPITWTWILLAASGCGPSGTVPVTGKLLKGGAAYTAPRGQKLGVTLIVVEARAAAPGEPYAAQVNQADGTFLVPGPDGRGVPPGTYRVSVVQQPTRDAPAAPTKRGARAVDRETDFLNNTFGPDTSPIVRALGPSGDLTIDLDRPAE